jgi:hypothetical protein
MSVVRILAAEPLKRKASQHGGPAAGARHPRAHASPLSALVMSSSAARGTEFWTCYSSQRGAGVGADESLIEQAKLTLESAVDEA